MRIGLTGSRGILGRITLRQLVQKGYIADSFEGDICDFNSLKSWASGKNFDAILHFAALVPTQLVQSNPASAFRVNVGGTANLILALNESENKPWFFYASSSHVYHPQIEPIKESAAVTPINTYGLTKRMGEQVIEHSASAAKLPWCIGRIFSFYHPEQTGSFLYPSLKKRFESEDLDEPFALHGMNDIRDLSLADDLVAKILSLAECRATGIINIGSGSGQRILDFAQSIAPRPLNIIPASNNPTTSLVADISRLNQILKR